MPSVFITGASGCVGHYLVDALSPDYDLHLLVRNPSKLRFDPAERSNIHIVQDDLANIAAHADLLKQMDMCVHVATAWGGAASWDVNVKGTHELLSLLDPARVRRIVHFSTASILGRDMKPLPEADKYGSDYIRSKYRGYLELPQEPLYDRLVTVFPTLIFGGDATHPISHLSTGVPILKRYLRILKHLGIEAKFHFIHARDIGRIVRWILAAPDVEKDYVMGNAPVTFAEFMQQAAAFYGQKAGWQWPLDPAAAYRFATTFGVKMGEWDRFCLDYKYAVYPAVNAPVLGLPDDLSTLAGILAEWEKNTRPVLAELQAARS